MKGIIKISTDAIEYELPLMAFSETEINFKSRALKKKANPGKKAAFAIWLQVPSRMNTIDLK